MWLHDNYEAAEGVSLGRSTLYDHYNDHCEMMQVSLCFSLPTLLVLFAAFAPFTMYDHHHYDHCEMMQVYLYFSLSTLLAFSTAFALFLTLHSHHREMMQVSRYLSHSTLSTIFALFLTLHSHCNDHKSEMMQVQLYITLSTLSTLHTLHTLYALHNHYNGYCEMVSVLLYFRCPKQSSHL